MKHKLESEPLITSELELFFNLSPEMQCETAQHLATSNLLDYALISKQHLSLFTPSKTIYDSIFTIIDMQSCFLAAKKPSIIHALNEELRFAMVKQQYILIVNYDREGMRFEGNTLVTISNKEQIEDQLHPELYEIIKDYPYKATIWKTRDNGANEILAHLKSKKISFSKICVSGINVCACVSQTVKGLAENNDNFLIELNESQCTCDCSSSEGVCSKYTIEDLEDYKSVVNSSKSANLYLKSAIINSNQLDMQKILSEYEIKIPGLIMAENWDELKGIKRDLLVSHYLIKSVDNKVESASIGQLNSISQLLDTIQTNLDQNISKRCSIM